MDWTESTFDTGEVRLHVVEGPASGPPVIFLHGATSSHQTWFGVAPRLAQRHQVILLDLRGHNLSTWGEGPDGYHLTRFTADISAFLLGRVRRPVVLVGHSLGGVVALLTAAHPAAGELVQSVIAEDPPLGIFRADGAASVDGPLQYFSALAALKTRAKTLDAVRAEVVKMMPDLPPEAVELATQAVFRLDPAFLHAATQWGMVNRGMDLSAQLEAIACPVLLMQADLSQGAALDNPEVELARRRLARLEVVNFPGASHGIHDVQPEQYLAAMEGFLA